MKSLSLSKPHIVIIVGIPGAGKSYFADYFSDTFNAPLISLDKISKKLFGHRTFNEKEKSILARISGHFIDELLKTKQTIVLDGLSETRTDRQAIAKKAHQEGYETLLVWVQTESAAAKNRVVKAAKGQAPIMTTEQFDSALKRFSPPHTLEKAVVISGKHTHASQLKIVLGRLVTSRAELPISTVVPQRTNAHQKILIR